MPPLFFLEKHMSAEAQTAKPQGNPIGLIDPDGRVWPYNNPFSVQMGAAGCKPIYSTKEYVERMRHQLKQDQIDNEKRAKEMEGVSHDLFTTDEGLPEREPVTSADVLASMGMKRRNTLPDED